MESAEATRIVTVLLDKNLTPPLDYAVPEEYRREIRLGTRVEVPFRTSLQKGTVTSLKDRSSFPNLRSISRILSAQSELPSPLWKLAEWMACYYATPLQKVLKCFIPPHIRKEIQPRASGEEILLEEDFFPGKPKSLNAEQKKCQEAIQASLEKGGFSCHLICGVTGSGKTEIYLQAIQTALDQKKSSLLLVPEISLTSQMIERFRARFPQHKIAVLHSKRSSGERTASWESLQQGKAQIALGARSALFCPAQNLGLIIVDEEHDTSYKQAEEPPCYHGRDVAVMRAHLEKCTILLGSATPSLESRYNAEIGKYTLHILSLRAASKIPTVRIVDMKRALETSGGFAQFSQDLLDAIEKRLRAGEQTLLFLNRRGYYRMQICGVCRAIIKCPHCDLSLTYHKRCDLLQCHLCDFSRPTPRQCPTCQSSEPLHFRGFGTEHVERALHAIFPEIRTLRMDRDTTRTKHSHEELFRQFRSHKADVLIGTQMIAKGFHFPSVTLVGVLNLDASLSIPDFRAPEHAFQLLTQVAGRAGRAELPGEVIFQTFLPEHPVLLFAASQDYASFYAAELEERRLFGYPPFSHLIKLLFSSIEADAAERAAQSVHAYLSFHLSPPIHLFPVIPAGHPKVKDLYRFQFLIRTPRIHPLSPLLSHLPQTTNVCIKIDVDPSSTFF